MEEPFIKEEKVSDGEDGVKEVEELLFLAEPMKIENLADSYECKSGTGVESSELTGEFDKTEDEHMWQITQEQLEEDRPREIFETDAESTPSTSRCANPSTPGNSVEATPWREPVSIMVDDKVSIGWGFTCSRAALTAMEFIGNVHCAWANLLLEGVFGNESHLMRMKKRNLAGTKKFPSEFLRAAKLLHASWLRRQRVRDEGTGSTRPYTSLEIYKLCENLPAYLADRSYSLYVQRSGRRGSVTGDQSQTRKQTVTVDGKNSKLKRRIYRKRGCVGVPSKKSKEAAIENRLEEAALVRAEPENPEKAVGQVQAEPAARQVVAPLAPQPSASQGVTDEKLEGENTQTTSGKRITRPTVTDVIYVESSSLSGCDEEEVNVQKQQAESQKRGVTPFIQSVKQSRLEAVDKVHVDTMSPASKEVASRQTEVPVSVSESRKDPNTDLRELFAALGDQNRDLRDTCHQELRDTAKSIASLSQQFTDFMEVFLSFQQDMCSRMSAVEAKMAEVLTAVSSGQARANTSAPDKRVSIGWGFTCSQAALDAMEVIGNVHSEWAKLLLEGVFDDESHLMRAKQSTLAGTKEFPTDFLRAAKQLHASWLGRQKVLDERTRAIRPYTSMEIYKLCDDLPAYLADRSYSLYVQRSGKKVSGTGEQIQPREQRTTDGKKNGLRRIYRKRDDVRSLKAIPKLLIRERSVETSVRADSELGSREEVQSQPAHYNPTGYNPTGYNPTGYNPTGATFPDEHNQFPCKDPCYKETSTQNRSFIL